MTWGCWVSRCQWDAACRAFLQRSPAFGVASANLARGSDEGYGPGWNKVVHRSAQRPPMYVFIGPDRGRTTAVPPDPGDGPVREVVQPPVDLAASALWRAFLVSADNLIAHRGAEPERVYRIRHHIHQAATSEGDGAWIADASRRGVEMIRGTMRRSEAQPVGVDELEDPVRQCVRSFLAFEAHGDVASAVVAALLFTLCATPRVRASRGRPAVHPMVDAVEHLVVLVDELLERRGAMNVPSYMQASYLAALYGAAAMHLAAMAREAIAGAYASEAFGEWRDADHDRLGQLALNIDETNAHRIAPTFVLPALYTPIDLLHRVHRMAAGGKRSPQQWAEFFQLDPALRAMLAGGGPWQEGTPREAAERHQALSDALPDFDVEAALGDRFRPVSRQLRTELVETLLAGRGP